MKNILLVVDVQNGFTRYEQTRHTAEKIKNLINAKIFDSVIATRFFNKQGSQYTEFLHWNRLLNAPDTDLVEGIVADYVVDKNIYTCLTNEFINLLIKINNGVRPKYVFIVGIDTDCCVLKIAVDLFEQYIMPIVLTDYCNSNGGPNSHQAGLTVLSRNIGKNALVSGSIIDIEDLEKITKSYQ